MSAYVRCIAFTEPVALAPLSITREHEVLCPLLKRRPTSIVVSSNHSYNNNRRMMTDVQWNNVNNEGIGRDMYILGMEWKWSPKSAPPQSSTHPGQPLLTDRMSVIKTGEVEVVRPWTEDSSNDVEKCTNTVDEPDEAYWKGYREGLVTANLAYHPGVCPARAPMKIRCLWNCILFLVLFA